MSGSVQVSAARNNHELIKRFEARIDGFNQRSLSFEDLESACQSHGIEVVLEQMREAHGAALWADGHPFIYINKLLNRPLRVFNLGHEFTHITDHLIDTEIFLSTGKLWHKSKFERHANIVGVLSA
ncbi:MAG TPA: ImmA/IrrE family metallo-endopeptidase [Blastocatellia bacterium]|nr:ImmA/IrrE family metallo-endopeptidase [Blastocatellia bacterium]